MDKNNYVKLKNKFGKYGSFTTWDGEINNISMFDNSFCDKVNTKYMFIAMNPSREIIQDFESFHFKHQGSKDYKLRYALEGKYNNCYITDLWKSKIDPNSKNIICNKPTQDDYDKLSEEIELLGNPILVAIGDGVYNNLKDKYNKVIKIPHYSAQGKYNNKDYYRKSVLNILK